MHRASAQPTSPRSPAAVWPTAATMFWMRRTRTPATPRLPTSRARWRTAASVAVLPPRAACVKTASRSPTPRGSVTTPTLRSPRCTRPTSAGSRSPGRTRWISSAAGTSATRPSCVTRPARSQPASPARARTQKSSARAAAASSTFRASPRRSTRTSTTPTAAATSPTPRPSSAPRQRSSVLAPPDGFTLCHARTRRAWQSLNRLWGLILAREAGGELPPGLRVVEVESLGVLRQAVVEGPDHGGERGLVVGEIDERLGDVARIDLPVFTAVEHPAAALLVAHLHAQVEGRRGLACALPGRQLDLTAGAVLREEQLELVALKLPAKHVDHVAPLRGAADRAELALRVIDHDEVREHVSIVLGRMIDPDPIDGVLGALGLVGQERAAGLPSPEAACTNQRQCDPLVAIFRHRSPV